MLGCILGLFVTVVVSGYKEGVAELNLAAHRYKNIRVGMNPDAVAALFELAAQPHTYGSRGPEVDRVDNFKAGYGETIVVYYHAEIVVGKCLVWKSDPRLQFPPLNPAAPKQGEPCY